MDETYEELESSTGVPAGILERSAEARAAADDKTESAVVAEWTGGEAPTTAPDDGVPAAQPPAASAPDEGLPAVEALTGEALLAAAAEAKGIPQSLVERSAQARADADGVPVEQVMREWVVEAGLATVGPTPSEPVVDTAPEVAPAPEPTPSEPEASGVEVLEPTAPIEETAAEDTVSPRTGRYPAWLAAALVIIPLLAVFYVVVTPNQPGCGSAGQVGVDPATGIHVNCDGSAYGEQEASNVLAGGEIFAASCAVCHGAAGQGGAGPPLAGGSVLETFPEGVCDSHIEWVTLGSAGWPDNTYGAPNNLVRGGMPSFGLTLTEEEIARVVLYERVALGAEDEVAAEADCGFG